LRHALWDYYRRRDESFHPQPFFRSRFRRPAAVTRITNLPLPQILRHTVATGANLW
jgi:hypothetical protein